MKKGENRGIIAGKEEGLVVRKYGHEHVDALNQILRILQNSYIMEYVHRYT